MRLLLLVVPCLAAVLIVARTALPQPSAASERGAPPRVLLDGRDVARVKALVATQPWAKEARDDGILRHADAWPAKYLKDFNLSSLEPPPSGGQWPLWYVCPDGTYLEYQASHSPPHFCSSTGRHYASPPQWKDRPGLYDEVIYGRRHQALAEYARWLGLAYALTGERRYALAAWGILRSYADAYPGYPQHDIDGKPGSGGGRATSQTLDEAIWLVDIAWAFDLVSDYLSACDRSALAESLLRPAAAVVGGNPRGMSNWQTWHNAALAAVGLALDDSSLVERAYNDPNNGFFAQLAQGAPDGLWWEGSWSYHYFALKPMVYLAEMGARAGLDTYGQPGLRAMLTAPLDVALPDLSLPTFNDSDDAGSSLVEEAWLLEVLYRRYGDARAPALVKKRTALGLLWGAEVLPESPSPPPASVLLPGAGYAVLRAGSADDPRYLALDFGPHGAYHGHFDKLGYVSYGAGRLLGVDPGTHSYASAIHEGWDKATVAHNTIVVDEQNQVEATGSLTRYWSLPALSLATADGGAVYPHRATISRTLALNADYWLDLTRARSLDGKPHRFDWVYHNRGALSTPLPLAPYGAFPSRNGYDYLAGNRSASTDDGWQATWTLDNLGKPYGMVYRNRDEVAASFTLAPSPANGHAAGRVDYDFSRATEAYAVYFTPYLEGLPKEKPAGVRANVYGDGSNNRLTLRFVDAKDQRFLKEVGPIDWTGWKTVSLDVDEAWRHFGGDGSGAMGLPIAQVALQIDGMPGAPPSGRLMVDDLTLLFPEAGLKVVEDFENAVARLDVRMLAAPDTTVVLGDGVDLRNRKVPYAMARRSGTDTAFAAAFEPSGASPRITSFLSLPVAPATTSVWAGQITAAGHFADSLMVSWDKPGGEVTFAEFTTDAAVAYLRQDAAGGVQTVVLAEATRLSREGRLLLASGAPVTLQVAYADDTLHLVVDGVMAAPLRLFAPTATAATLNGSPAAFQRDGPDVVVLAPAGR